MHVGRRARRYNWFFSGRSNDRSKGCARRFAVLLSGRTSSGWHYVPSDTAFSGIGTSASANTSASVSNGDARTDASVIQQSGDGRICSAGIETKFDSFCSGSFCSKSKQCSKWWSASPVGRHSERVFHGSSSGNTVASVSSCAVGSAAAAGLLRCQTYSTAAAER